MRWARKESKVKVFVIPLDGVTERKGTQYLGNAEKVNVWVHEGNVCSLECSWILAKEQERPLPSVNVIQLFLSLLTKGPNKPEFCKL